MAASIDGRIVVDGWPEAVSAAVRREYEAVHTSYAAEGWICGRVTMEPFAGGLRADSEVAHEYVGDAMREDFTAPGAYDSFAFAIDSSGRLAWKSNDISGDHVVAILAERVSDEYLTSLRDRGVSYVIAGPREVDLSLALTKIRSRFGVRTLMLEGGGKIDGGMLRGGLINEISVLIAPVADGRMGRASLFDVDAGDFSPSSLVLEQIERRADDVLWLRYRVKAQAQ